MVWTGCVQGCVVAVLPMPRQRRPRGGRGFGIASLQLADFLDKPFRYTFLIAYTASCSLSSFTSVLNSKSLR